jgi:cell division septum initiation protein DivIVA
VTAAARSALDAIDERIRSLGIRVKKDLHLPISPEEKLETAQLAAERTLADASSMADEMRARARREAADVLTKARHQAERITGDSRARAESLERDAQVRHLQAMESLLSQRETLEGEVQKLTVTVATARAQATKIVDDAQARARRLVRDATEWHRQVIASKSSPEETLNTASRVLWIAQETADQAIADARREANDLLTNARRQAEQLVGDACARAIGIRDVRQYEAKPLLPVDVSKAASVSLTDAIQVAHMEGWEFGSAVARDAPTLWLEALLARNPRMPSDLEARLLQGSALSIDFLLHDEVRNTLRQGFWEALENKRRQAG